jgi:predicted nucleic acid-binding protein
MIVYALDSNIISYFLANDKKIIDRMNFEIDQGNEFLIPPIVYYEIRRGLMSFNAPKKTSAFEELCIRLEIGIIERETLEIAAALYARLKKKNIVIEDADLLIAAYCIRNDLILVTNNVKHFINIEELNILNWIDNKSTISP